MKEVLTKSFWEGVKKTFNDALEGKEEAPPQAPVAADNASSSAPEPVQPPSGPAPEE